MIILTKEGSTIKKEQMGLVTKIPLMVVTMVTPLKLIKIRKN